MYLSAKQNLQTDTIRNLDMVFWKYYIFPHLKFIYLEGQSINPHNKKYFIKDDNKALLYMKNKTLRHRYFEIVDIIYPLNEE
uniref:Uncharacterized protein n=1 Tax=viral metagenome TaxID=1070528 RepID=A0A6C0HNL5_9ZZZZ